MIRKLDSDSFNVLCLDGGGSLGVFTLGVLEKIEELCNGNLCNHFDLIYGTSTGAIISSFLSLGYKVKVITKLYFDNIPNTLNKRSASEKSQSLERLAKEHFDRDFNDFKTGVGIITLNYETLKPLIFKNSLNFAHNKMNFTPGFGVTISEAVVASCSAFPFFNIKEIDNSSLGKLRLIDGGYIANNPSLYSIIDCLKAINIAEKKLNIVSIGTGNFPLKSFNLKHKLFRNNKYLTLFQKVSSASSITNDQLLKLVYPNVNYIRINATRISSDYRTNFLENDTEKLYKVYSLGKSICSEYYSLLNPIL